LTLCQWLVRSRLDAQVVSQHGLSLVLRGPRRVLHLGRRCMLQFPVPGGNQRERIAVVPQSPRLKTNPLAGYRAHHEALIHLSTTLVFTVFQRGEHNAAALWLDRQYALATRHPPHPRPKSCHVLHRRQRCDYQCRRGYTVSTFVVLC
jgi:hypothetical protein